MDMIERLPTPWGLVRLGVAPDHPKLKEVSRAFEKIASRPGFRFLGNVEVGKDVAHDELVSAYDAVVYAVGAQTDKQLGIPGEDLPGSWSATELVAWYNGHPDFQQLSFDLSVERAVVVGNGNVALDVARMLALTRDELAGTDTTDPAIEAISRSGIREIVVLGRRGPVQASWTPPELAELGELADADVVVDPAELELDAASAAELETATPLVRRNFDVLRDFASREPGGKQRTIRLRFRVSPVAILGAEEVEGVEVVSNRLEADASGRVRAIPTRRARDHPGRDRLSQRRLPRSPARRHPVRREHGHDAERRWPRPGRIGRGGPGRLLRGLDQAWRRPESSGRTRRTRPRRSTSCSTTRARAGSHRQARPVSTTSSPSEVSRSSPTTAGRRSTQLERARGAEHGRPRVKLCTWEELLAVGHGQPDR